MLTAPDQNVTNFRGRLLLAALLAVAALALYLWGLFTAQLGLLNLLGIASFCLLLLGPVAVAYQTVRLNVQRGAGAPLREQLQASLRRSAGLIYIDALAAVPIFVLFSLYLQIALANIFMQVIDCFGTTCPPESVVHPETFIPQAFFVLLVALGLWSLNLLACILGTGLALRWQRMIPATSGTILILVVTVAVIYTLLNLTGLPQIPVDLAAAVLPYLLVWGAWSWFFAQPV